MSKFPERLRELRKESNLSQNKLATALGLKHTTIGLWEQGKRVPNFDAAILIANYFDVNLDYLAGLEDQHHIFYLYILLHDLCKVKHNYTKCVKKLNMKDRLKELRKEKGVSQKEVASALGISLSAYSNYEQGIREPNIEMIIAICRYYDVSSDYLLGLED